MKPFRTFSKLAWFLFAFLIIGLLAMGWWVITAPGRESAAKAGQVIAQGQTAAGRDAVGITAADAKADAATVNINRENTDDIRNAPGADAPVDPALAAAGRRGLCRYEAYRNRPECL